MKMQLSAPEIYLASQAVDFRKNINGLSGLISNHYQKPFCKAIYVFYNRSKNKLKLLAYHRNGCVLIYKQIDKKKFTIKESSEPISILTQEQLSWLIAGLDWVSMSQWKECDYLDYF